MPMFVADFTQIYPGNTMELQWKDTSSHSQRDTDRTPKTWVLNVSDVRIVVTRHIHHEPTDWILNCDPWFEQVVISRGTADEAKAAAIAAVKRKLDAALNLINRAAG